MIDTHETLRCPKCQSLMQTGFVPVSRGMHFIRGDGTAASHFAEDLPGTHAIMRTNRLLAWRCKGCQVVVFKYGRDNAKLIERLLDEQAASKYDMEEDAEAVEEEEES